MIKYAIVDDEPIAHRIIEGYCKDLDQLRKVGNCYDSMEANLLLQKHPADLLFLDIKMPKLTGFEFIRTLKNPPMVIVTSAHKEYALESFDLDVCDYLLKPFSFERFLKAVNKAVRLSRAAQEGVRQETARHSHRVFIKGDKKIHQVALDDILFIEAFGNYCKVVLPNEVIITLQKISDLENSFSHEGEGFIRIHKSFIVPKSKISTIEGNQIFVGEKQLPIGQTYKSRVNELLR